MAWHVTNALVKRRNLARNIDERRILARTVAGVLASGGGVAFHAPDDHIHLLLDLPREEAGAKVRAIEGALSRRLKYETAFGTPFFKPVEGRAAVEACLLYILRQARHHGSAADPLAEASNLPDLLGLRVMPAWSNQPAFQATPRLTREKLIDCLGLVDLEGTMSADALLAAAASAVGCEDAGCRRPEMVEARRAAWKVGREMGLERKDLAKRLQFSDDTAARAEAATPDPRVTMAIRLQLRARGRLGMGTDGTVPWVRR